MNTSARRARTLALAGCLAITTGTAALAQPAPTQPALPLAPNAFGLTLDHVTIGVADFDKEIDWYHRALGLQPNTVLHTPKFEAQKMTGPGIRIDLIHQDGSVRPTPTMGFDKQGYMHVALVSPDLQTLYDHLTGMGVAVEANRDKSGKLMVITFQDPEGNAVEVLRN